jgi:hypothetical protein
VLGWFFDLAVIEILPRYSYSIDWRDTSKMIAGNLPARPGSKAALRVVEQPSCRDFCSGNFQLGSWSAILITADWTKSSKEMKYW